MSLQKFEIPYHLTKLRYLRKYARDYNIRDLAPLSDEYHDICTFQVDLTLSRSRLLIPLQREAGCHPALHLDTSANRRKIPPNVSTSPSQTIVPSALFRNDYFCFWTIESRF